MTGLATPGARVWLSRARTPGRKLAFGWELVEADFGDGPEWVGVNTMHPNLIVAEAVRDGRIPALAGYERLRREVKYGANSRIDLLLEGEGRPPCYVEVKNVHLMRRAGLAEFPDCVTARGTNAPRGVALMAASGARAMWSISARSAQRHRLPSRGISIRPMAAPSIPPARRVLKQWPWSVMSALRKSTWRAPFHARIGCERVERLALRALWPKSWGKWRGGRLFARGTK